jgi:hypothetical protein
MGIIDEIIGATPVIDQAKGFIKVALDTLVTNATSVSSAYHRTSSIRPNVWFFLCNHA